jgi:hypothetical protein
VALLVSAFATLTRRFAVSSNFARSSPGGMESIVAWSDLTTEKNLSRLRQLILHILIYKTEIQESFRHKQHLQVA